MSPCLRQDEARVHKVTKRIHTLEEVNINVKLLTEMLSHYDKDRSTDSDRDIIKVCVKKKIGENTLFPDVELLYSRENYCHR